MFSRFYKASGPWIAFLRKAWQKKIPQRSEDDFLFSQPSPQGGRLVAKTRQSKTFAA